MLSIAVTQTTSIFFQRRRVLSCSYFADSAMEDVEIPTVHVASWSTMLVMRSMKLRTEEVVKD